MEWNQIRVKTVFATTSVSNELNFRCRTSSPVSRDETFDEFLSPHSRVLQILHLPRWHCPSQHTFPLNRTELKVQIILKLNIETSQKKILTYAVRRHVHRFDRIGIVSRTRVLFLIAGVDGHFGVVVVSFQFVDFFKFFSNFFFNFPLYWTVSEPYTQLIKNGIEFRRNSRRFDFRYSFGSISSQLSSIYSVRKWNFLSEREMILHFLSNIHQKNHPNRHTQRACTATEWNIAIKAATVLECTKPNYVAERAMGLCVLVSVFEIRMFCMIRTAYRELKDQNDRLHMYHRLQRNVFISFCNFRFHCELFFSISNLAVGRGFPFFCTHNAYLYDGMLNQFNTNSRHFPYSRILRIPFAIVK